MPCVRPIRAWYNSQREVVFTPNESPDGETLYLNCGGCITCRKQASRNWAIRATHEAQMHERTSFLTLTYDDEHLPADGSLQVKDWQLFAKRLRKQKGRFRFLHCGEYGDEGQRPHYHALIYGHDFLKDRRYHSTRGDNKTWLSDELDSIWQNGYAMIGSVSYASASYVAKYIVKKATENINPIRYARINPDGELYQVKPEYATMSRRPGLGASWFAKYWRDVYPSDQVVIDGHVMKPPAYYDTLLEQLDPDLHESVMENRREFASSSDRSPAKLRAIEGVATARAGLY